MKICDKCGIEIINGVNGCMLNGDICDNCSGFKPDFKIVPGSKHNYECYNSNDYDNYIDGLIADFNYCDE